ncbi:MAG: nucleotidyltransferase domain-containing protein [Candidatus Pacearchaeota archaeon]|nr:nucleotidyltransferase domain-containing protein [Candidatus Pacearchaeota archaeon]
MIEKLFTSKIRVKVLEYLFFRNKETHIREISRDLKLSSGAVKREIDNLALLGIIEIKKNRIILNKNCNFLKDLKNIFVKTDFIVYPLTKLLVNKHIEYAFIFGSFASGDYKEESDIDLMMVGNMDLFDLTKLLRPLEDKIKREINPVAWKLKDLIGKKNTGFVKDIFAKKIIMLKGDENELRKIVK